MDEETGTYICDVCGKTFGTAQGLKVHQARMHGPKRTRRTRRVARPAPTGSAPELRAAFEAAANALDEASGLLGATYDGVETILAKVHDLRAAYIGKAVDLRKLQQKIAELDARHEE